MDVGQKLRSNNTIISSIIGRKVNFMQNNNLYDKAILNMETVDWDVKVEKKLEEVKKKVTSNDVQFAYVVRTMKRELRPSTSGMLPEILKDYNLSLYPKKKSSIKVQLEMPYLPSMFLSMLEYRTKQGDWVC